MTAIAHAADHPINRPLEGGLAWAGPDLPGDAGLLPIPAAAAEEIEAVAALLADNPLPILALDPRDFALDACRALMGRARRLLEEGPGFAIIDRLPVERFGREVATQLYWLLAGLVARPVAQKWDGTMVYGVRDLGRPPGNGVRPDITNAEQNFHVDNSYNICPPDVVGLLCLQTAMQGGVSGLVSFAAAHNAMRARHPDLLPRLWRPFIFDRQREHAPGDVMTHRAPIFELRGNRMQGRISKFQIVNGHALAGEALDAEGQAALAAFDAILEDPALRFDFHFQPGQIQLVNNRALGHKRTGFTDWPEPERKRHLVRLWLRAEGRPFYNG
jgi:alpha-ketoglutarate-dependent taurine dioxygenase